MKISLDLGGKSGVVEVATAGITFNKKKITWKKLESLLDGDKPAKKAASKAAKTTKTTKKKPGRPKKTTVKSTAAKKVGAKRPGRPKGSKNKKK